MTKTTTDGLFACTMQKADEWIDELMHELGTDDPHVACAALRTTLHALRDRLSFDESAQLAAQLPIVIRGIYFEGWKPQAKPRRIRRIRDFLNEVESQATREFDLPTEAIVRAVFKLIARRISEGEITDVVAVMPREIRPLWP